MELLEIAKLGSVPLLAIVLYLVVQLQIKGQQKILDSQKAKDELFIKFIGEQEERFNEVILNHLEEETKAKNDMNVSFTKLSLSIDNLCQIVKDKIK